MADGASVAAADPRALTVWYDGDCPMCSAEIALIRRLDRDCAIAFVDLSVPGACSTDLTARLARLHAQPREGPVLAGAAAFVAMWRVLPLMRPLAALASIPPVLWVLERAYRMFLKLRPTLQAVVRWGLAHRVKRPR